MMKTKKPAIPAKADKLNGAKPLPAGGKKKAPDAETKQAKKKPKTK